ncbi:MAG: DUF1211 domain-containing protein [Micropruina sp.]|nr:MAG: DUF1211 domain-containing protein [Micropruina sp.]
MAIAITLLALPLMEAVPQAAQRQASTVQYLTETAGQWTALAISFFVIATLWFTHHSLFAHVGAFHPVLFWLNAVWAFTVVVLSVLTGIIGSTMAVDASQKVLYIGTMFLSAVCIAGGFQFVGRHPELWNELGRPAAGGQYATYAQVILTALALVIVLATGIGYVVMLLLFGVVPLGALLARGARRARRPGRHPADGR